MQLRSDRHLHPCWGLFGGQPGAMARSILNPGTDHSESLPSKFVRKMRKGDVFRAEMPGSGGYGDPFKRDPEAVCRDVIQGKVTPAHALTAYGVAIDVGLGQVDQERTARIRASHPG